MTDAPITKAQLKKPPAQSQLWELAIVGGVFCVCLIRLAGFVHAHAVNVFYSDQWDALWPLAQGQSAWGAFFMQHGPHRLGLGGLLNWCLYSATQWDVRAEAWSGVIMLGLAAMVALGLSTRLRGRLSWTDAAFPLLVLSLVHWETLTFTTFPGAQILPLLLTLLLAGAWSIDRPVIRTLGVCLLGPLTLFSGYGMCGAPVTIGLALLLWLRPGAENKRADRQSALAILISMAVAAALFATDYGFSSGTGNWRFPVPNWWDYPRFCALMFTNLLGWRAITPASTVAGAGVLVLVLAAFFTVTNLIWRRQATARIRVVWALTGTTLIYAALTALGRLPTTLEAAFMWRYTSLLMPGVCGLYLLAQEWAGMRGPGWRLGAGLACVALSGLIWSNFTPENYAATIAKAKRLWVASYLSTRNLEAANQAADFGIYPQPASPALAEKLRVLEQRQLSFFRTESGKK